MNKLEVVKAATELVVSLSVGSVVGNTIKSGIPAGSKLVKKVSIGIGGLVISSMIADMASKYATDSIDNAVENLKDLKDTTIVIKNTIQDATTKY